MMSRIRAVHPTLYRRHMQRTRWEYMTLDVGVSGFWLGPDLDGERLTEKLNELGQAGWEALGITAMETGNGRTRNLVILLKRPAD